MACGRGFNSRQLHHLHFERNTLSLFKNPVEALSLRGFVVFRCCLRPKKAPWKTALWPIFTLHSPKLVDLRVASQQVGVLKNQQLTHSQKVPFFLTPRLGELSNKNNSKRLSAKSCWFGRCSGVNWKVGSRLLSLLSMVSCTPLVVSYEWVTHVACIARKWLTQWAWANVSLERRSWTILPWIPVSFIQHGDPSEYSRHRSSVNRQRCCSIAECWPKNNLSTRTKGWNSWVQSLRFLALSASGHSGLDIYTEDDHFKEVIEKIRT